MTRKRITQRALIAQSVSELKTDILALSVMIDHLVDAEQLDETQIMIRLNHIRDTLKQGLELTVVATEANGTTQDA